jgi:hypothetical protein
MTGFGCFSPSGKVPNWMADRLAECRTGRVAWGSQAAIEAGDSVRFQTLVTMELAVTDAVWHGHAGIDK